MTRNPTIMRVRAQIRQEMAELGAARQDTINTAMQAFYADPILMEACKDAPHEVMTMDKRHAHVVYMCVDGIRLS